MAGVNKVIIVGNLGRDPEVRDTSSGAMVANLSVATSESWVDKSSGERTEKTEWHRVVFFGRTAEVCAQYLTKGSQVYVEGRIETQKWQDAQGQDRYTTQIIGREMQMLGSRQEAGAGQRSAKAQSNEDHAKAAAGDAGEFDDDIPF